VLDETPFLDLIRRVRAGDKDACCELVRRYEPAIRSVIRNRLSPRLRRLLDSFDLSQSVLKSFFPRAAAGRFVLDTPEQLTNLLAAMVRNKLHKQVRRQQARRRDCRRVQEGPVEEAQLAAPPVDPLRTLAAEERLRRVRALLTEEEWQVAELRDQGHGWIEIATRLNASPDALRMKYARSIQRVADTLGTEESTRDALQ
jgi:RNA polymerase sigma-70 factor (ECF subfamily)